MPYLQMAFKTELTDLQQDKLYLHLKQKIIKQLTQAHMYS